MNKHKKPDPAAPWAVLGNTCFWPLIKPFFDVPTKTQVSKALMDELKNNSKANPAHVASLLIMSLFVSFLFSNSASKITWDLVNVAYKVKDISYYNWSLIVIQFLGKGLTKHKKDKPVTLSRLAFYLYCTGSLITQRPKGALQGESMQNLH
ncbi:hypothetical protein M0R45_035532 [Rubus argutus]|uniref:Uncharacterized protein n=1 Tax=Rubus argutus TaxID=59490 RepID=A0AAW1VX71_RUBAR